MYLTLSSNIRRNKVLLNPDRGMLSSKTSHKWTELENPNPNPKPDKPNSKISTKPQVKTKHHRKTKLHLPKTKQNQTKMKNKGKQTVGKPKEKTTCHQIRSNTVSSKRKQPWAWQKTDREERTHHKRTQVDDGTKATRE